ncbi:MAG: hypothetical protein Q9172_007639 [Xanthocarpia lactea]
MSLYPLLNPRRKLQLLPTFVVASSRKVKAVNPLTGDMQVGHNSGLTLAISMEVGISAAITALAAGSMRAIIGNLSALFSMA